MSETILEEADRLITSNRLDDYGTPEESLSNISNLWTAYIKNKLKDHSNFMDNFRITSKDVTLLMTLFKISREQYSHKRDNLVDAVGYIKLAAQIENID